MTELKSYVCLHCGITFTPEKQKESGSTFCTRPCYMAHIQKPKKRTRPVRPEARADGAAARRVRRWLCGQGRSVGGTITLEESGVS